MMSNRARSSVHEEREQKPIPAVNRSKAIIREVLTEHWVNADDFFGSSRAPVFVAARIDVAQRLRAAGLTDTLVARAMKRDRATVANYFPERRRYKRRRYEVETLLRKLAPEQRKVVQEAARAEDISVQMLVVRWIAECAISYTRSGRRSAA
jgi:predicted transcriptional regulator